MAHGFNLEGELHLEEHSVVTSRRAGNAHLPPLLTQGLKPPKDLTLQ